jgi:hypothetical protein
MDCSLFNLIFVPNSVFPVWKLLVFELLLGMSALQVNIVTLLDALQLIILFAGTLTYLEPKLFLLIIFYNVKGKNGGQLHVPAVLLPGT